MGIGPVPAMEKLAEKHGLRVSDFGLIELNEAFAAQVLACDRVLNFNRDRLNVNGGAIALGHPIGCTGTRITVTLDFWRFTTTARVPPGFGASPAIS